MSAPSDPDLQSSRVDRDTVLHLGELARHPAAPHASEPCADCLPPGESINDRVDLRPVLVTGVARSGTTWVSKVLSRTRDAHYVHEPDNPAHGVFAHSAKRGLGRYPYLRVGDRASRLARCYEAAFVGVGADRSRSDARVNRAFSGVAPATRERALDPSGGLRPPRLALAHALASPRGPRGPVAPRIVKSVHTALCLEWIAARWDLRIVVVRRHPMEVIASWMELGVGAFLHNDDRHVAVAAPGLVERYGVAAPAHGTDVQRVAWLVGLLMSALDDAAHTVDAEVVDYETLCRDPIGELRWLSRIMGLTWTADAERFVRDSDRPGAGEHTFRVASEQPGRWPQRLDARSRRDAVDILVGFDAARRYPDLTRPGEKSG